jgi:hypothetical protein
MDAAAALRRYLEDAHAALARGEAADAERQSKAISARVWALTDLLLGGAQPRMRML